MNQTIWIDRQTLPHPGFNPCPVHHGGKLTVLYRKPHGTFAQPTDPTTHQPLAPEYLFHAAIEDFRLAPNTNPPLLTGALYSRATRQAAIIAAETQGLLVPITRPILYTLSTPKHAKAPHQEKNWLIWPAPNGALLAVYNICPYVLIAPTAAPTVWAPVAKLTWHPPAWTKSLSRTLRCSTPPVYLASGDLLILWHLKDPASGYWTGASIHAHDFPFRPIAATAEPLLTPADATAVSPHWPPNTCVYPMHLTITPSYTAELWAGDSDRTCCILRTPVNALLRSMEPIT